MRCTRAPLIFLVALATSPAFAAAPSAPTTDATTASNPARDATTPARAVDALLAADRAYSAASATRPVADGLTAMLARDTTVMLPRGEIARDPAAAKRALAADAALAGLHATWTPTWAGLSADGEQGFTLGYLTLRHDDGREVPQKYLAYWIREDGTWKVAAYRRRPRAAGAVDTTPVAPIVPARLVAPRTGTQAAQLSAANAERAFSDRAQVVGLRRAFEEFGAPDAMNMGGPDDAGFVVGNVAIATVVGAGESGPSSVSWGADRVIAASSEDLAVSIGMIRLNAKPADEKAPSAFPFFTIWHRADATKPWRYVAE